ncbi:MAG: UTP--glucose-1-phosphate uridylyltransferase [Candidatus Tenebribacter davisii]|nr:UTP--glucose-1-phosphate uridylyltransferase [Candidatus Tenebribacter davisii]
MKSYLTEFVNLMEQAGLNDLVIQSFSNSYYKILEGATGKLSEDQIQPPAEEKLIDYNKLKTISKIPLSKLAVIKLNGGLGTSMGLDKAKTLLRIKGENNFLDIIVQQILHLRKETYEDIPLVLMHSFNTQKDSLSYLEKYGDLAIPNIPLDFRQNKFPKIKQSDLSPLKNENDNLNWNPPGHGEIYTALAISGVLDKLLNNGFEYIFISNSDNLGAVVDEKILTYFAETDLPFMMEVCQRTEMDKKGGHLAQTTKGQLILRETAQCPDDEIEIFQDIDRYSYFNTNNLWVNLKVLKQRLYETRYLLPLTMILNKKSVNGEKVYQVESAMGSAISVFKNSRAMIVQRDRFAPVKTTNDMLAILSDAYELTDDLKIKLVNEFGRVPHIELNNKYYKNIHDFEERFKNGIPSLKKCKSLVLTDDVHFGENVEIRGDVKITKERNLENIILANEEL